MTKLSHIPIIVGPTAVGKTAVSIDLARRLNAEIISADSRQIYRYMNIGTATPSDEELAQVSHHFVNTLELSRQYTAGQFSEDARIVIREIRKRGKNPMVVGGAGFYIKALLDGLFETPSRDKEIREKLYEEVEEKGIEPVYERFQEIDPDYADDVHPNDVKKVVRALEIYEVTGEKPSRHFQQKHDSLEYEYTIIGLNRDRQNLYDRINRRVDVMFERGLIDEVQQILDKGYSGEENAIQTVGYQEVIAYFEGKISLEEAKHQIKKNSRHYAKRQLTWFRNQHDTTWFRFEDFSSQDELVQAIADYITK